MNFLEICQDVFREAGIPGNGPVSVTNQKGMSDRVVHWVRKAWISIQSRHDDWNFLKIEDASFDLVGRNAIYTAAALGLNDVGNWDTTPSAFRIHEREGTEPLELSQTLLPLLTDGLLLPNLTCLTPDPEAVLPAYNSYQNLPNQIPLKYCKWAEFRERYGSGEEVFRRPEVYTVNPLKAIQLWPTPDEALTYTITMSYFRAPQKLVAATDVPRLAERYHDAIVRQALLYYAAFEDAPEVYADSQSVLAKWVAEMEISELPQIDIQARAIGGVW